MFAAAIPLLVGFVMPEGLNLKIAVGLLGVVVAVISGVLALHKFQENWIQYRCTTEALMHEKFLFMTRTEPYDQDPPFPFLVHRVESLISTENSSWVQYIARNEPIKYSKGEWDAVILLRSHAIRQKKRREWPGDRF